MWIDFTQMICALFSHHCDIIYRWGHVIRSLRSLQCILFERAQLFGRISLATALTIATLVATLRDLQQNRLSTAMQTRVLD